MKHIFGPVNSRRLGRSLGVDLFTDKICNLNCIYCEVGATTHLTCDRAEYVPTAEIIAEIDAYCADRKQIDAVDFVTVTASGEPTLHSGFGEILQHLKDVARKPVAVLTNGATLMNADIRRELALADVVIPSLDSALANSFRKIDRPATCLDLQDIIDGLVTFSQEYHGQLWLEILFARGINDSDMDVLALIEVVKRMRLDRIQLNTVARPPHEAFAQPLDEDRLQEIRDLFQKICPAIPVDLLAKGAPTEDNDTAPVHDEDEQRAILIEDIVQMLKRRPCTAADINRSFHVGGPEKVEQLLAPLVSSGKIQVKPFGDKRFYQ